MFDVSRSTVQNYERQERKMGDLHPRKPKLRAKASRHNPAVFTVYLSERNDATLAECRTIIEERCGIVMSIPSLCRLLGILGLNRKKNASRDRA